MVWVSVGVGASVFVCMRWTRWEKKKILLFLLSDSLSGQKGYHSLTPKRIEREGGREGMVEGGMEGGGWGGRERERQREWREPERGRKRERERERERERD